MAQEGHSEEGTFERRFKRFTEPYGSVGEEQSTCEGPETQRKCKSSRASRVGYREGGDIVAEAGGSQSHSACRSGQSTFHVSLPISVSSSPPSPRFGTEIADCRLYRVPYTISEALGTRLTWRTSYTSSRFVQLQLQRGAQQQL